MIERMIYTALAEGISELQAAPVLVERIFREHGFSAAEARRMRETFTERSPNVIHNYPRQDSAFPLYAIVLGEEKESHKFLDDMGNVLDAEDAELLGEAGLDGSVIRTSLYQHEFHVMVVTEAPDTTIANYELAKYILTRKRQFLKDNGVLDSAFSGGDLAPDDRYMPAYLFVRRLSISAMSEARVIDDGLDENIREVTGMHVDDGTLY